VSDTSYGVAASSLAAAESTGSGGSGWEFAVTPYLWMSGFKADINTPQGEDINVDESFTNILGDLKFAMMGAFEAKHGRFVSVQDLMYLSLGASADGHIGPVPIDADVDEKLLTTTHLFGYRVVDDGPMFVDLFAGGRITTVKVDVDISGPIQTIHRDSKKTQFGPVIASRVRFPLSEKWGVAIYGDLGGFGVGADLSWQLLGTVQYDLSDRWRLLAGWRHFNAKQSKNNFDVDIKLDGPILGATYRF
jgi:opacity protein-like surface antigen